MQSHKFRQIEDENEVTATTWPAADFIAIQYTKNVRKIVGVEIGKIAFDGRYYAATCILVGAYENTWTKTTGVSRSNPHSPAEENC
jgi:hypothetical protein